MKFDIYYISSILGFIFSNITQIPHLYKLFKFKNTDTFSLFGFSLVFIGYINLCIFSYNLDNKIYFSSSIFKIFCICITIFFILKNKLKNIKTNNNNNDIINVNIQNTEQIIIDIE